MGEYFFKSAMVHTEVYKLMQPLLVLKQRGP